VDLLVVVGAGAVGIADGAVSAGQAPARIIRVADREEAFDALRPRLVRGDVVLLKGSRGAALDLLVDRLRDDLA